MFCFSEFHKMATDAAPSDIKQESLTVTIKDQANDETVFKVKPSTILGKLFTTYAQRKGVNVNSLRYYFDGQRLNADSPVSQVNRVFFQLTFNIYNLCCAM